MTLNQFAAEAGVSFFRCEPEWGGTWAYRTADYPNSTHCGYKTRRDALRSWMVDAFGERSANALEKIIESSK